MKLSDTTDLDLTEARYLFENTIMEDGEGPRWKFNYDNWHNDPKPDILLLGAYRHPGTGNNLVGGINLNYLDQKSRDKLAKHLPKIMAPSNLKRRYWAGRTLVPEVFNTFYRTYNSQLIRGVTKDVLYPKYGFLKTARDWIAKKYKSLLQTKKQREADNMPKYSDDLQSMQDRLDQAVAQLNRQPNDRTQDTPEVQAANKQYTDMRKSQVRQSEIEDEPMDQAVSDINNTANKSDLNKQALDKPAPTDDTNAKPAADIRTDAASSQIKQSISRKQLQDLEAQNKENLSRTDEVDENLDITPKPQQSAYNDDNQEEIEPVDESIAYYSPITKSYVQEYIADIL